MIVSTVLLSMLLSSAPQEAVVLPPNPNGASVTSTRFRDNEWRTFVLDRQADAGRQDHEQRVRQREYRTRLALADRLDQMISDGDCVGARGLAFSSTQADIAREVDRICAAREAS
jgi:hypothetical protein